MAKSDSFLTPPTRAWSRRRRLALWPFLMCGWLVGCDVHVSSPSGNGSDGDLKFTAKAANYAAIPDGITTLEVQNYDGAITLTGTNNGSFQWTQTLTIRAHTEEAAQAMAKAMACRVEQDINILKLIVSAPSNREPASCESDFKIIAPANFTVKTHNRYGSTTISHVSGLVDATDESGSVTISHVDGEIHAQTSYASLLVEHTGTATLFDQSGQIDASDIQGPLVAETSYASLEVRDVKGPVKLRNQSGSVSLNHAGPADVQTSYATLRVSGISGDATLVDQSGKVEVRAITGKVTAATSYAAMDIAGNGSNFICHDQSGDIQLHANSATLTNLQASTSYGSLEVWLSRTLDHPAIRAHTSYAQVESDFPMLSESEAGKAFDRLPPGTPRVTLENQSGKISVRRE